ncbi:class I SAM-dependent DNA methyltransferase [Paenibacillus eucommiae]|uniref:SAM-dependent methyltransferase n=1 Tax=Paenibacillus eucommiae TaxID=1355755 RepID=A0ABS4J0W5_9BACL|nr:class I SAM-dependent methyltransferase [Paenibacillus eucommiae]MBP1992896.1 SAM-dependent methyltransferase [Paenibacillus eucommiae]
MSYQQFAYTYDRLMEGMPYEEWLRFTKEGWSQFGFQPASVVDLGCGTGNLAIPLSLEGLAVTGIDLSEDMLAVARHKADGQPPGPKSGSLSWVQQDIREWELAEPVDAVICYCDSMNYLLEEQDILEALRQTYQGLKPGGVFLFDVHTPRQLEAYAESQPFFLNEEDVAYIWTSEWDEDRMEIEHALTIFVKDAAAAGTFRRIEEHHIQRAYPLKWLEEQLYEVGFSEVRTAADFHWQMPTGASERAFFAARK